jgi:hypothetical protein
LSFEAHAKRAAESNESQAQTADGSNERSGSNKKAPNGAFSPTSVLVSKRDAAAREIVG